MASGSLKRTLVFRGLDFTTQQTTSNDRFACLGMIRSSEKIATAKQKQIKQTNKKAHTKQKQMHEQILSPSSPQKRRKEKRGRGMN